MSCINPPQHVTRKPRGIDMPSTKANESRNLLFYYSVPCFRGILKEEYFDHWCLLVEAIALLSKKKIRIDSELQRARIYLNKFCVAFSSLYGKLYMHLEPVESSFSNESHILEQIILYRTKQLRN